MTFVIFGATGDLAKRKLYTALDKLNTKVIGIGRKNLNNKEFRKFVEKGSKVSKKFLNNLSYYKADFKDKDFLRNLKVKNPVFYLAVSYEFMPIIVKQLKRFKNAKVVFEKPFGHSLASSNKLDKSIKSVFADKNIYRIDHYLAKQTVQNILGIRFSNPLFENVWNNKFINHIHIVSEENIGVEQRLEYYDKAGAIRDMIQSHLLQIASLVLMEPPKTLQSVDVHNEKVKILKCIKPSKVITGQYKGYKIKSNIETYAEVKLVCNAKRWKGTPIVLKTGKKLKKKQAYVEIEFKKTFCKLYCNPFVKSNKLIINIQPKQDIIFDLNTLTDERRIEPVEMQFCHTCKFGPNTIEAYQRLLSDVIKGDKTLFTTSDELKQSWIITDKIEKLKKKPIIYSKEPKGLIH